LIVDEFVIFDDLGVLSMLRVRCSLTDGLVVVKEMQSLEETNTKQIVKFFPALTSVPFSTSRLVKVGYGEPSSINGQILVMSLCNVNTM
jgi:hypothetical protein